MDPHLNTNVLFVIGNGFDLWNGMETRYSDFENYLSKTDSDLLSTLEKYNLNKKDVLWKNFESCLSEIDEDQYVREALDTIDLIDYDPDGSFEANVPYLIGDEMLPIFRLPKRIGQWASEVNLKFNGKCDSNLLNDPRFRFLSFNYTKTLEQCYGVPSTSVLHIHGVCGGKTPLVIGSVRRSFDKEKYLRKYEKSCKRTEYLVLALDAIEYYYEHSEKNTSRLIVLNDQFFKSLTGIKKIVFFGFSFGQVDMPYIKKILQSIPNGPEIFVSVYVAEDQKNEADSLMLTKQNETKQLLVDDGIFPNLHCFDDDNLQSLLVNVVNA